MQTILLTGAGGGIGSATKAVLEASGAHVIAVGRQDADLTSYEEVKALCKRIAKDAPLDWLVFAHGFISTETEFEKQKPADIKLTFDLNILSDIYLTQLLLPSVRKGGGVIFISSTAGLNPNGKYATYSASKAAVNAFSQALARNKPEHTFFSVCPGPTNTTMRERVAHDATMQQSPDVVARVVADIVAKSSGYKSGDTILVRDGEVSIATQV
ncbi:SDR family oxidoreductase [Candidatus Kaiserbacteria bacterium]|nr:SDR family oxidoreductase [Candidatus Kaiserbacteria bacterium]